MQKWTTVETEPIQKPDEEKESTLQKKTEEKVAAKKGAGEKANTQVQKEQKATLHRWTSLPLFVEILSDDDVDVVENSH